MKPAFREWEEVHAEEGLRVEAVDGERLVAARQISAPGRTSVRHRHDLTEEILIVTEGEIEMSVGEEARTLGPGDAAVVPPGVEHGLHVARGAKCYMLFTPGFPSDDYIVCE